MLQNKLEGVKPFNDFLFKSCYYHQLMAGLACFGIDTDAVLLNSFVVIGEGFSAENKDWFEEKKLAKAIGYKNIKCNVNQKKLVRFIDGGDPVIVGVDCYYLESRPDTYLKNNSAHFVLLYGYDLEKGTVNIIDHNYINSGKYIEKEVSLENILLANKMFRKGVYKRKYTCRRLKRTKKKEEFDFWNRIDQNRLESNREMSARNLYELKQLFVYDLQGLKEQVNKIVEYLKTLKTFYFSLSKTRFFLKDEHMQVKITELTNGYSNILSLLWKMRAQNDYEYVNKKLESILRKVEEIRENENGIYNFLLEVCDEHMSKR